jgi:hypothetical protein
VTASFPKELYSSPNGDRWLLSKDAAGALVVVHQPNESSGGRHSEVEIELYLAQGGHGPEHQALVRELAALGLAHDDNAPRELSAEETERLSRALGQAVARCWSSLPQDIQHDLFEAAVTAQGETVRQQLAIYLHGKHERTVDAQQTQQTRAVPTPDSLGG